MVAPAAKMRHGMPKIYLILAHSGVVVNSKKSKNIVIIQVRVFCKITQRKRMFMLRVEEKCAAEAVISVLPERFEKEIIQLCRSRMGGLSEIREIRLRASGRASVRLGAELLPLFCSVTAEEITNIVTGICGGAVYAQRDKISEGYISFDRGVRVGIVGSARYEGRTLVGVDEISSLVFRIPGSGCDIADELESAFFSSVSGMLIYSAPGGGKTTALRSLARTLGSGKKPLRVCVVDEREEFFSEDYRGCEVDILRGYKRQAGLEIATRTMSPDVVMIDEIGCDDAIAIKDALRCGVPIVATAHARTFRELMSKTSLRPLFEISAFDVFAGISERDGRHILTVDKNERNN